MGDYAVATRDGLDKTTGERQLGGSTEDAVSKGGRLKQAEKMSKSEGWRGGVSSKGRGLAGDKWRQENSTHTRAT
jgi:hypothetical protein